MTMIGDTGGGNPIKIANAMGECGIAVIDDGAHACNAGNTELSRLAGVNPGQALAWSMWQGKTYVPEYGTKVVANVGAHIDRINELYINLETGATRQGVISGDHNPRFTLINTFPVGAIIGQYRSWRVTLQFVAGNQRVNVCVIQQAGPGNWECMIRFDDQGTDNGIAGLPGNIQGNGANMNGDTDCQVNVLLTMVR